MRDQAHSAVHCNAENQYKVQVICKNSIQKTGLMFSRMKFFSFKFLASLKPHFLIQSFSHSTLTEFTLSLTPRWLGLNMCMYSLIHQSVSKTKKIKRILRKKIKYKKSGARYFILLRSKLRYLLAVRYLFVSWYVHWKVLKLPTLSLVFLPAHWHVLVRVRHTFSIHIFRNLTKKRSH